MRRVFLATSYPSNQGDPAGHFVRAEALRFARAGDDVHVLAPAPFSGDPGITTHPLGGTSLFAWPGANARLAERPTRVWASGTFALQAIRVLRRLHATRIEAHWLLPCAFPLAYMGDPHAAMTVTCHGADIRLLLAMPLAARQLILERLLARNVTFRLVAGALRDALLAQVPASLGRQLQPRLYIQPPSVDVQGTQPYGDIRFPYAIISGRLVHSKRADLALAALQHLPPSWHLVVLGDGPQQVPLTRLAQNERAERVHFLGNLPRPEALRWVAGARVMLHPSEIDAAPTAVLEALALGVPVVSGGAGDVAQWPGVQVVERTPRAFAQAACGLLFRFDGWNVF